VDIDFLRGVATILCMAGFFAVVAWAYSPGRKARFEEDGRLPFEDETGEQR
jgi:cytochrome c oxidase cbb3-type subunit 4